MADREVVDEGSTVEDSVLLDALVLLEATTEQAREVIAAEREFIVTVARDEQERRLANVTDAVLLKLAELRAEVVLALGAALRATAQRRAASAAASRPSARPGTTSDHPRRLRGPGAFGAR